MKYLFDDPHNHDYLFMNRITETTFLGKKLIGKDLYACVHCGVEMAIYDLDNIIEVDSKPVDNSRE